MKKLVFLFVMAAGAVSAQPYQYPATRTVNVSDTYHGVTVADPYRWLENIKDPEVIAWFKAQADYTNAQMAQVPGQNEMIAEMKALDELHSGAVIPLKKVNGYYFYRKRMPGEQVARLFVRKGENGAERLLFDPEKHIAGKIFDYDADVNDDGSLVLLTLSEAGTELGDVRLMDVKTARFLADVLPHSYGQFARGQRDMVHYLQMKSHDIHDPENKLNLPFKSHRVGMPVSQDRVLASAATHPELKLIPAEIPYVQTFKGSPVMLLSKSTVDRNLQTYLALPKADGKTEWKPFSTIDDEVRNVIVHGNDLYFVTTKGNDKMRVLKTSVSRPDIAMAETVAEGSGDWAVIDALTFPTKDYLIITKSKNNLQSKLFAYNFKTGKISEPQLPNDGLYYASPEFSDNDNELSLVRTGWTSPMNNFQYDIDKREIRPGYANIKFGYPGMEDLVFEEVEVPSHDGVLVPLSIVYNKKMMKKDGSNPLFMAGYGAYGSPGYVPQFMAASLPMLNRGVILAFAHVRGGGAKGNDWYLAGKKATKPNTWKDANACTEWLIKNKYTSTDRMGIEGRSAGGIMVGRAITERPDLYRVAFPHVGALNTLREEFTPNGPVNIPEFGTVKDPEEFKALMAMDAHYHTKKGDKYPAQLITTGFNDPRVSSYIPAKYAAGMQAANASERPIFLDVDYSAGHFGGSTMDEFRRQLAREYAFFLWQVGRPEFQIKKQAAR